MNILMLTNTYTPFIGGVPRSVESFTLEYRRRGHRVIVIAPEYENTPPDEADVIRVPAIQRFNGTDFSVQLPVPGMVTDALEGFTPDIVHSHHPYLIGDTALRLAARYEVPIVYTSHTLYERYTHYVPGDSPLLRRFVVALTVGYANLCDRVFAPSGSIARLLLERGVEAPVEIVPTGIDVSLFADGDGRGLRAREGIPPDAFVIGFVSRIAPEKNILFLSEAVGAFLLRNREAHFLLAGKGSSECEVDRFFRSRGLDGRVHRLGSRTGRDLTDAYHAMDVFAFASESETQGMVVTEAMAAGVPVVALDAPGVREVVIDGCNGLLLSEGGREAFVRALGWVRDLSGDERRDISVRARETAGRFTVERCADRALAAYAEVACAGCRQRPEGDNPWEEAKRVIRVEWEILSNLVHAAGSAVSKAETDGPENVGEGR